MAGTEHQWLTMGTARQYVEDEHNLIVTRQTVHNWAKKGRKEVFLKTEDWLGRTVTRKDWVDDFVAQTY